MSVLLTVLGIVVIVVGAVLMVGALGGIPTYRRTSGRDRHAAAAVMAGSFLIGLVLIVVGGIVATGAA